MLSSSVDEVGEKVVLNVVEMGYVAVSNHDMLVSIVFARERLIPFELTPAELEEFAAPVPVVIVG